MKSGCRGPSFTNKSGFCIRFDGRQIIYEDLACKTALLYKFKKFPKILKNNVFRGAV
jgi:hypothetical protein